MRFATSASVPHQSAKRNSWEQNLANFAARNVAAGDFLLVL
ncbi:MAG: hypothetical protein R2792_14995 [Saprospiraceae bacterium]